MESLSKKRLIINATVNGYEAPFLVDTGATVGLIDRNRINEFRINQGPKYNGTLVGAGGKLRLLSVEGKRVQSDGRRSHIRIHRTQTVMQYEIHPLTRLEGELVF